MKQSLLFFLSLFLISLCPSAFSQTTYIVDASNYVFTPKYLTVTVGDTVTWENKGGYHSVLADNGSFSSGAASTASWTYSYVFKTAGTFPFHCTIHGGPGGVGMSGVITVQNVSAVSQVKISPDKFELRQNYPNPFNPSTSISFSLPAEGHIRLTLYNTLGEKVATLIDMNGHKGVYNFVFEASSIDGGLSSGIYLYKLQEQTASGNYQQIKKMVLLK